MTLRLRLRQFVRRSMSRVVEARTLGFEEDRNYYGRDVTGIANVRFGGENYIMHRVSFRGEVQLDLAMDRLS